jgi:hypothetical protein
VIRIRIPFFSLSSSLLFFFFYFFLSPAGWSILVHTDRTRSTHQELHQVDLALLKSIMLVVLVVLLLLLQERELLLKMGREARKRSRDGHAGERGRETVRELGRSGHHRRLLLLLLLGLSRTATLTTATAAHSGVNDTGPGGHEVGRRGGCKATHLGLGGQHVKVGEGTSGTTTTTGTTKSSPRDDGRRRASRKPRHI